MPRIPFTPYPDHQHGMALLIIMLIFFLGGASWILAHSNPTAGRDHLEKTTASALAQAKAALIGRAATDNNRPGSLPCPDTNNDGVAELFVGANCPAYIGRLPWKTLDLPELLDGSGERLWYAISPGLRDNTAAEPINPLTVLQITLDGSPPPSKIAAIVFSPGPPLPGQNGRPSNNAADYLDGSNSDGDNAYVSGPPSSSFNDKLLVITRNDIFRVVNQRVLGEIRGPDDNAPSAPNFGLRNYYAVNAVFPWADGNNDGVGDVGAYLGKLPYGDIALSPPTLTWLTNNGWPPLIDYSRINAGLVNIEIKGIPDVDSRSMNVVPCPSSPCP